VIIAIDDDPTQLELIQVALEGAGFEVRGFTDPHAALDAIVDDEPELILADIVMPDLDGFALRAAVREQLPHRSTPFVFLSSLASPDDLVRGLEVDVDDYLVKPIDARVLAAKVHSIVARHARGGAATFAGDIASFPFIRLLQFCELHGLTGEIEFFAPGLHALIPFRGGQPEVDAETDTLLPTLYDLDQGRFVIRSRQVDFSQLKQAPAPRQPSSGGATRAVSAMGRLSAVEAGSRQLQVQTELTAIPSPGVLTVVLLDGATVLKRVGDAPGDASHDDLQRRIDQQHLQVEQEIRDRLDQIVKSKAGSGESNKQRYYQLFEQGFEAYRDGAFDRAVTFWEEAQAIFPDDGTLETNLTIARAKLTRA